MNHLDIDLTEAKVMVVDDTPANMDIMRLILEEEGYRLFAAPSGEVALKIAPRTMPHLILLDVMMPGIDGFETCRRLKAMEETRHIPIIFVTAKADMKDIVEGFKAGGVDYINKPIRREEVVARVRTHLEIMILFEAQRDLTKELAEKNDELEAAYQSLEEVSLTDPLTGLKNRRFVLKNLDADSALALRSNQSRGQFKTFDTPSDSDLIFFMLDIDHFKSVNDTHGHAAGDLVLTQVHELLRGLFRESDYLVRWGGEEFLIIARFTNRQQAPELAERIRHTMENFEFYIGDGKTIQCTCSVGFACFPFIVDRPEKISWSQVIDIADHGMYAAKKSSRNAWVGFFGTEKADPDNCFEKIINDTQEQIATQRLKLVSSIEQDSKIIWKKQ